MTPDNLQVTLSPEHLSISSSLKAPRKAVTFICFIFPIPDVFRDSCPSGEQMLLLSLWTWVSTNEAFTDVCIDLQHFRMTRTSVHMTPCA